MKRFKNILFYILISIYLFFAGLLSYENIFNKELLVFGQSVLAFSGIVSMIFIVICSLLVIIDYNKGFKATLILYAIELILLTYSVVVHKNFQSYPGYIIAIVGIIISYCLRYYIKVLDKKENSLYKISITDEVTSTLNRHGMIKLINDKVDSDKPFYIAFADLDNFKSVNDTFGHKTGDNLLREVTYRWVSLEADFHFEVGRAGGDEFIFVIDCDNKQLVEKFIDSALDVLSKKSCLGDIDFFVSSSFGLASFPKDATNTETLLSYADTAMYKSKNNGKNQKTFFSKEIYHELIDKENMENIVKNALKKKNLIMEYQPQYDSKSKKLFGLEALVRIKHNNTIIYPDDFILISESSNLIYDLDWAVLEKSCMECRDFVKKHKEVKVSVNISSKHLVFPNFVEDLINFVEKMKFPKENLILELTEPSFIKSFEVARENIEKLYKVGIHLALDDFGTGYSSLRYVNELNFSVIKIDKSFLEDTNDKFSGNIIKMISQIGHIVRCKIVAEGVENDEQYSVALKNNIDLIQGFYFDKPMPISKITSKFN